MKRMVFLLLAGASILMADLNWASSYEDGLIQAKKQNKLVMVMFSTTTCKICKYMKGTVYEDADVMEYVENFYIPIDVDIVKYPDKYGYQVFGTPTYYFLDSKGKQIGRMMVGGTDEKGFLQKLQEVKKEAIR